MSWKPKLNPVTVPPRALARPEDWVDFIKRYMTDHTSFRENLRKWTAEIDDDLAALPGSYQPLDATLTAFAALAGVADRLPYFTGADAFALATFTSFARTLLDDANAAAAQSTLGLVIGTNVQAYDTYLDYFSALTGANTDRLPYFDSATSMALTQFTASARTIINKTLAKGDLITASAAATAALLAIGGTNGLSLIVNSGAANGMEWGTPPVQMSFGGASTAATTAGSRNIVTEGSTTAAARYKVPTGKTLYILSAIGSCTSGATVGTYEVDLVLHNATDTADTVVATFPVMNENVLDYASAFGTLASPLATLAAGKVFGVGWLNNATSPGALAATARAVTMVGVFV